MIIWWNFRFFHNSLQNFCFFSFDKICVFAEILHSCFFRDSSDEFFCASFFPRFLPKVEIFAILLPKVTFIQGFFAESQVFPWFYTESRVFLYSMLKAAFFYDFLTKCILFLRSLGKSHVFPQFFCRKSSFCSRFFAESRVFCDTLPKIAGFFFFRIFSRKLCFFAILYLKSRFLLFFTESLYFPGFYAKSHVLFAILCIIWDNFTNIEFFANLFFMSEFLIGGNFFLNFGTDCVKYLQQNQPWIIQS